MNPTLTKASEALRESLADWQGNGDLPTFEVIAVLKAIRDPSEEMVKHAAGKCWLPESDYGTVRQIWTAMIDAITNHNPTANQGSGE